MYSEMYSDKLAGTAVNGILFPTFIDPKITEDLLTKSHKSFSLHSSDVFIVTYPKSGTTWTQRIVSLIRNEGKEEDTHLWDNIPLIEVMGASMAMNITVTPRCFTIHLPYHMMPGCSEPVQSVAKYIYIARNPKDVAVSYYHHARRLNCFKFNGDCNCFFELFMKGEVVRGSWFDHVLEWWKHRDANNILFLKYEDMKNDLPGAVKTISEFMGYNFDDSLIAKIAEMSTFDSMKGNPLANPDTCSRMIKMANDTSTSFLRKGVVGDWRNHFSDEQSARLDAEYDKKMTGSGLEFEY